MTLGRPCPSLNNCSLSIKQALVHSRASMRQGALDPKVKYTVGVVLTQCRVVDKAVPPEVWA